MDRYGFDAVQGAITYVCDAAAERMSEALATIEDQGSGNTAIRETLDSLPARVRLLRATSLSQPQPQRGHRVRDSRDRPRRRSRNEDAMAAACEYHVNQAARSGLSGLVELDEDAADVLEALDG